MNSTLLVSSSFPFFKLPLLVQILIVKNLNLGELFNLSLLSRRSREVVAALKLKVGRISWNLWSGNRNYYRIELIHSEPKFTLSIVVPLEMSSRSNDHLEQLNVDGLVVPTAHSKTADWSQVAFGEEGRGSRSHLILVEKIAKILLELFECEEFEINLKGFYDIRECFLWKCISKQRIRIREFSMSPCSYTQSPHPFTSGEMKYALSRRRIEHFTQYGQVQYPFKYSGPLKMSSFSTENGSWLTLDALLNMKCVSLSVLSDSLSDSTLNAFVSAWKTGEKLKKFNNLHMTVSPDQAPRGSRDRRIPVAIRRERLKKIVQGIETLPLDRSNWGQYDRSTLEGFDICRSDGLVASALFSTDCLTSFIFRVHRPDGWVDDVEEELEEEEEGEEDENQYYSDDDDSESSEETSEESEED